jgi:excisionase family DNA binding protein
MEDELLTVAEVARTLKVTRQHIYDLMREKQLAYVQIGLARGRRIRRSALEAFLNRGLVSGEDSGYTPEDIATPTQATAFEYAV